MAIDENKLNGDPEKTEVLEKLFLEGFTSRDVWEGVYMKKAVSRIFSKKKRRILVLESQGVNYRKKIKKQKKQLQRACQMLAKLNKDENYPKTEKEWIIWLERWSFEHGD